MPLAISNGIGIVLNAKNDSILKKYKFIANKIPSGLPIEIPTPPIYTFQDTIDDVTLYISVEERWDGTASGLTAEWKFRNVIMLDTVTSTIAEYVRLIEKYVGLSIPISPEKIGTQYFSKSLENGIDFVVLLSKREETVVFRYSVGYYH